MALTAFVTSRSLGNIGALSLILLGLASCVGPTPTTQVSPTTQDAAAKQEPVELAPVPPAGSIVIDGSSTVYPITSTIAEEYTKTAREKASIDVKFSGTTSGFRKLCAGQLDISNASRPISTAEMETCNKAGVRYIELPVAFDALTIAVNPQNSWASDITVDELKTIWEPAAQGKITNWNQVRPSYPNRPLKLFGAGKDSGTYDYFNEVTTGDSKQSRADFTASEDDNVLVQGIEKDPGALGYIPFAYYEAAGKQLKALAVDTGKGAVLPSRETVEKATYQPFSRPLLIYINAKSAQTKPEVKAFVDYYLRNARRVLTTNKATRYIPLPEESYALAETQFYQGEVGSVFDGVPQTNVTIDDLLRRQAKLASDSNQPNQK